jgi:hypothetical protein
MKLVEITQVPQMDTGAPSPTVIADDNNLFVTYYKDYNGRFDDSIADNPMLDNNLLVFKFQRYQKFVFGPPNDETIAGHRYFKLGLVPYAVFELEGSDVIEELKTINAVHPYFNSKKYDSLKHYIITFHDRTFECVAEGYEQYEKCNSIYSQSGLIIDEIFKR